MTYYRSSSNYADYQADESRAEQEAMYGAEMRDRARKELIERCAVPGEIRSEWLNFCDECREVTAEDFIRGLEDIGHDWFERAVAEQWENFAGAMQ